MTELSSKVDSSSSVADPQDQRVPLRTKFFFGVGTIGETASNWIFLSLAFFYYERIIGLSAALAGIATAIAIFADAITDPAVGAISDRFRSRWGRRHPFMFLAPIPLAFCIFLLFNPPEDLLGSQTLLFSWFVVFTILMRAFQTFFAIPHLAMGAELSDNYIERTRIMSFNNLFGLYGGFGMNSFAYFLVFGFMYSDQEGRLYQPAYTPIVLTCMAVIVISILVSAYCTRDQIPRLKRHEGVVEPFGFSDLLKDVLAVLDNRNYRFLLIGLFFLSLTIGTHETLGIYMAIYFWELTPYQQGWLAINTLIGYQIAFFTAAHLHGKFDKRWTIVITAWGLTFFWSLAANLALLGFSPAAGSWNLVFFIIGIGCFSSFCGSVLNISVMSALADIADEHALATGKRQEGIFYSARTFFAKAMNAIGHVVAGFALEFYILLDRSSPPGEVPEDVVFRLGMVDGPFAMVGGLIAGAFYLGYRLDKKRYAEIREELAQKDSTNATEI